MQGHLDLEPVLLVPGLRCSIGSAEGCAVRLTKSELVHPEHCVIEVTGRQTKLTAWISETTWLNDRLVTEPRELVPGDRVSLGPFDFRLRLASAEELLYAKLVERESADSTHAEDVVRLKRALDQPNADAQSELDLFSNLLHETSNHADSESHERLTQHISKLLGDLQNQVLALQEREADLSDQLRQQQEAEFLTGPAPTAIATTLPPSTPRPDDELVRQQLQAAQEQLEQERSAFTQEQARFQEQQLDLSRRLEALESQLAELQTQRSDLDAQRSELETQRSALREEKSICRALAEELLRDKSEMMDLEDRLRREETELASRRDEFLRRSREQSERPALPPRIEPEPVRAEYTAPIAPAIESAAMSPLVGRSTTAETAPASGRPVQTFFTLIAFGASAIFLGTEMGDPEIASAAGWAAALVGAISTADLLLHRISPTAR